MSTFTVTIDVADFVPNGVAPRLAFVTFSRLIVDDESGEIVTTSPVSIRVTQDPATVTLTAGVTYKVRGDGISGVGTFYAAASTDLTLAQLRDQHQIDPLTLQPIDPDSTVGESIAELRQLIAASVVLRGAWVSGTPYPKSSLVIQAGAVYLAAAAVPARATFTAGDWQVLGGAATTPTPSTGIATTDNGNGTFSASGAGVVDNGDGTFTLTDSAVTDNGDGTFSLAA